MKRLLYLYFLLSVNIVYSQSIPEYYQWDPSLSRSLSEIVSEAELSGQFDAGDDGKENISLAVIDLSGKTPLFGGVYFNNFIYPASVYKMYAGMEVLKQISQGHLNLYQPYIIQPPNDVDRVKEIKHDPRPLLHAGDTATINYLLDLMITRSDNSAANCIIDIASRDSINKTMHSFGWYGSEVTRKFVKREFEDPGYDTIRGTETCALHAADFMYKVYTNTLVSPWVSMQMKSFLARQLDTAKLAAGLPDQAVFYHKTGWWSIYTNDVGIVDDGHVRYIIALFTPVTEEEINPKLKVVSDKIYQLMKGRMEGKLN